MTHDEIADKVVEDSVRWFSGGTCAGGENIEIWVGPQRLFSVFHSQWRKPYEDTQRAVRAAVLRALEMKDDTPEPGTLAEAFTGGEA